MKDYIVRAELDQTTTAERRAELTQQLAGHQPFLILTTNGRTQVQLTVTGHDMWQAVLAAMVALTHAECAPTTMHIAQSDEQ